MLASNNVKPTESWLQASIGHYSYSTVYTSLLTKQNDLSVFAHITKETCTAESNVNHVGSRE